ncbi:MAG: hypothetical protein C0402_02790 [Thermodesulfovibrio sp.]|nr:hypothetical protein [Thermodesulfovibrio sp.]
MQKERYYMKNGDIESKSSGCFTVTCEPVPEYLTCPNCGLDIEFWTVAEVTRCFFCGQRLFYGESTVH